MDLLAVFSILAVLAALAVLVVIYFFDFIVSIAGLPVFAERAALDIWALLAGLADYNRDTTAEYRVFFTRPHVEASLQDGLIKDV